MPSATRLTSRFENSVGSCFRDNPSGGGSFADGRRWLGRHSPLRGAARRQGPLGRRQNRSPRVPTEFSNRLLASLVLVSTKIALLTELGAVTGAARNRLITDSQAVVLAWRHFGTHFDQTRCFQPAAGGSRHAQFGAEGL